ncbi:MAG: serine acetyltransferase [Ignavibacteriae bacterium HGW-Ignavibacteriae-1]|jgi:serine O-acetyltransferase|nr:MAG: serine acetyltransferase [Ignavibacteriae bacterium HGW-Ignavibacteriae-1]
MPESYFHNLITALKTKDKDSNIYRRFSSNKPMPSSEALNEIIQRIKNILFPGFWGYSEINASSIDFYIGTNLDIIQRCLSEQIKRVLCFNGELSDVECNNCIDKSKDLTKLLLDKLPFIKGMLVQDIKAAFAGDPAATSYEEVIYCYPGIIAITYHRIAHELHLLGIPIIPRMINEAAHSLTGIDIHPGAAIGDSFFIDHGTGVVIGETCIIGKNVRIYQGVTLGSKSFPVETSGEVIKGIERHPIIGDNVVIYANATILGRIKIKDNSIVKGNAWITKENKDMIDFEKL